MTLLIALGVAVTFWSFRQLEEAAQARTHTHLVLNSVDDLLSALKDAETGQRGYLLTGDETFLAPYLAVRDGLRGQLDALRQLTLLRAVDPHLNALAPLIDAKLAEMAHLIDLRRKQNMVAVLAAMSAGQGKRVMDSIRAEMRSVIQLEEGLRTQRETEFQSDMHRLFSVIVTASFMALVFSLSFAYLIYRQTQQRLKNLVHLETQHLLERQQETNRQLAQANATLQVSEEKLAVTLYSIGDGVIATDAQGCVTLLNPLAEQLTGWTQAQANGRPVDEIFHIVNQDTRQPATIPVMETLKHGTIQGLANHTVLIARDGSECAIADSCAPIRDRYGQVVGAVLVFRNVTEEYAAQQALRDSTALIQTILNTVVDGIITLQASDGVIETLNPAAERMFGYSAAELIGQNFSLLIPELAQGQHHESLEQYSARDQAPAIGLGREVVGRRKDGDNFPLEIAVSEMRLGGQCSFTGILRDISARKLVEDELDQHRHHLEQLVSSRTAELAEARDAAEAANLAKSSFLATMSHELRTPLNAVVGLTGLLADSPLGRRQRDYADKIQLSAQALRTLIDHILDFSKIEAGDLRLEQAPFSLNAILRTTASVLGVALRHKPIEALFEVAPDIPDALIGDALRLQQILLNLTSNAVKFTEAGAIVVSVRCLARDAGQVTLQLAVRDTGIGIPAEQLGPIFDGFVQADTSTSRLYGGSGLGLTISARLAHLMGGQIGVQSELGSGSEFCLDVTLALGISQPQVAQDEVPSAMSILIIDDHPLARDILTQTCAGFGWQATAVDCGAAGLAELRRSALEDRDYDLMLLDWRMPGMDGIEMLRQAYATADIGLPLVVLMVSIFELEQAVAASDDLYLDGIAAKPMTPASLYEAVTRAYAGEFATIPAPLGKTDRRLAGMRLLVAEDNELNQEVIEQVLTRAGAEVVMVANGRTAVAALRVPRVRFDVVLMDIQMPGMDGYAATRIIREGLGLIDLPIIAVTAFARPEDREKSRAAGMVGHLVKPIDVEDLLDLVARERQESPGSAAVRPDAAEQSPAPAIQLPGLNLGAALQTFGGDQKRYGDLLHKFVMRHGGDADEALRLFNIADAAGAAGLLHGLSGMASLLQATELARLAAAAEGALLDGRTEAMPPLFDELQVAMRTLEASIDQLETLWADA
jgi:PAS domain S-box-containing protein